MKISKNQKIIAIISILVAGTGVGYMLMRKKDDYPLIETIPQKLAISTLSPQQIVAPVQIPVFKSVKNAVLRIPQAKKIPKPIFTRPQSKPRFTRPPSVRLGLDTIRRRQVESIRTADMF